MSEFNYEAVPDIEVNTYEEADVSGIFAGEGEMAPSQELEESEEGTVFVRLIKIALEKGLRYLKPIAFRAQISPELMGLKLDHASWNRLPQGQHFADGWKGWMSEYTVSQMSRVAQRFLGDVVYTNDDGYCNEAFQGFGAWNDNGVWVASGKKDPYILAVTGAVAATALMAAAGVKVVHVDKKAIVDGAEQIVGTYQFKDLISGIRVPHQIKQYLYPYLVDIRPVVNGKRVTWTPEYLRRAPFLWCGPARNLVGKSVESGNYRPISAYMFESSETVSFPAAPPDFRMLQNGADLSYKSMKHVIANSWYAGGVKIPQQWFQIWAQAKFFRNVPWSGNFAKDLPNYARFRGTKFEGTAPSSGPPYLDLDVKSISTSSGMTGVVWAPTGVIAGYSQARGVAVPMSDTQNSTLKPVAEWIAANPETAFCFTVILAPQPFFLVLNNTYMTDGLTPVTLEALKTAYDSVSAMSLRNFVISLFWARDPKCPVKKVIAFHPTPQAPVTRPTTIEIMVGDVIPGRYCPVTEVNEKADALAEIFDRYTASSKRRAGRGLDDPSAKRPAHGEPVSDMHD